VELKERLAGVKGKDAEFGDISHFKIPDSEEEAAVLCEQYDVKLSYFDIPMEDKKRKLYSAQELADVVNSTLDHPRLKGIGAVERHKEAPFGLKTPSGLSLLAHSPRSFFIYAVTFVTLHRDRARQTGSRLGDPRVLEPKMSELFQMNQSMMRSIYQKSAFPRWYEEEVEKALAYFKANKQGKTCEASRLPQASLTKALHGATDQDPSQLGSTPSEEPKARITIPSKSQRKARTQLEAPVSPNVPLDQEPSEDPTARIACQSKSKREGHIQLEAPVSSNVRRRRDENERPDISSQSVAKNTCSGRESGNYNPSPVFSKKRGTAFRRIVAGAATASQRLALRPTKR
jgi:hypothetical protein